MRDAQVRASLQILGRAIAAAREEQFELAPDEFAKRLGVSPSTIRRIEEGNDGITTGLLTKVCYELDCLAHVRELIPTGGWHFPRRATAPGGHSVAESSLATVGHRIYINRAGRGYRRAVFAKTAGISADALTRLERGDPTVRLRVMANVCQRLGRLSWLERVCDKPLKRPEHLRSLLA